MWLKVNLWLQSYKLLVKYPHLNPTKLAPLLPLVENGGEGRSWTMVSVDLEMAIMSRKHRREDAPEELEEWEWEPLTVNL